jgi:dipeptidyl aminopeptidase/acylaminoacyl peptidase
MHVDDGRVRTVLAAKGSWSVEDVDPAGKRLLVGHYRSSRDASVHLLDLETGALKEVLSRAEKRALGVRGRTTADGGARFLGDGGSVVLLSDLDPVGFRWPFVVSLATGGVRPLVRCGMGTPRGCTGCPRDVDSIDPTRDGREVVVVENQGGQSVVTVVDVETGVERAPLAGDPAVLGGVALDATGRVFATVAGAVSPASVAVWSGEAGAPWRTVVEGDLAGIPAAALPPPPREVHYPSFDGRRIPAWLHLPAGAKAPIPFVVSVHGGPEGQARPSFLADRAYLLSLGYGVLAPNVRGSTGYGREWRDADDYRKRLDSVRDVRAAAEWLAKEGWAPKDRIAVHGGSYGGYVVLACLTEFPDTFAAGVDVVGIANFETFLERTADYRRALREEEYGPLSDREFLRSISPIHKVDRIRAPLLVAHGENDPRVPVHEARQIEAALRARGTPVRALYFPDEGHGWQKRENRRTYLRAVAEFLRDTVGAGAGTAASPPAAPR